jgi:hypothetical protein
MEGDLSGNLFFDRLACALTHWIGSSSAAKSGIREFDGLGSYEDLSAAFPNRLELWC